MLGELSRQDESDGCLNLTRRDGRLLVVRSELGSLGSDALEDVVDEGAGTDVSGRHSTDEAIRPTHLRIIMALFEIPVSG